MNSSWYSIGPGLFREANTDYGNRVGVAIHGPKDEKKKTLLLHVSIPKKILLDARINLGDRVRIGLSPDMKEMAIYSHPNGLTMKKSTNENILVVKVTIDRKRFKLATKHHIEHGDIVKVSHGEIIFKTPSDFIVILSRN